MVEVPITIACGNYDRTQAIKDGVVKVEGCAVTYLPLYPEEIFFRAFRYAEFDVSEISFSSYIRTVAAGTSAYIGIPAFVSRIFRNAGSESRRESEARRSTKSEIAGATALRPPMRKYSALRAWAAWRVGLAMAGAAAASRKIEAIARENFINVTLHQNAGRD